MAGRDAAFFLRRFDHAQGDAVFDAAAGVEEFAFGVDGALKAEGLGDAVEADERGVADVLEDGAHDCGRVAGLGGGEVGHFHSVYGCSEG